VAGLAGRAGVRHHLGLHPACLSLIAMPIPPNPAPMIATR